jgi:hypothetical protein
MKNGRAGADEATKMVYGAKPKATVKRTKEQEMVTEAAEYTATEALPDPRQVSAAVGVSQ